MVSRNHLARFHAVIAMVAAAMHNVPGMGRAEALAQVGGYESRGKGRNKPQAAPHGAQASFRRAAVKARNVRRNRLAHR